MVKWIVRAVGGIALMVPFMFLLITYSKSHVDPYGRSQLNDVEVPRFKEVNFPFTHKFGKKRSLPFLGSAVIDIDGDGTPEVFMGGGYGQTDMVLSFEEEGFADATDSLGRGLTKIYPEATFGAAVIDVDNDGRSDIFVARDSGITLYYNRDEGFIAKRLDIPFNEKSTPLSIALTDLNSDGHVDMFVSTYIKLALVEGQNIFNKENYGSTSLLLMNNGDDSFTDITSKAGIEYVHNTFVAVFSDVDGDADQDLIVAHDTGQVRTWRNNGDLTFAAAANPSSDRYGYPMGVGVGDINNDSRIDFMFSNISTTAPRFIAKGDLRNDQIFHTPLLLFQNQGAFNFTDVAAQTKVADYEFSWGIVLEDLNNDGREDALIAQNYVSLPLHKVFRLSGRTLLQKPDGTFGAAEKQMGLVNRRYEISPLVADFNSDGHMDLVRVNLAGPSRAFLNEGGSGGFIKIRLPDRAQSLGALVDVTLPDGKTITKQFTSGEGLASDQTHDLLFGLGSATSIKDVRIRYADGTTRQIDPPSVGETVVIY